MNGKSSLSHLKVFYGWAKQGKVRKRESISVIYENEAGVGSHNRMGKTLTKLQETVYERWQTVGEAADATGSNRVFTEYAIFLDDPKINGSLDVALHLNSMSDRNNVSEKVRKEIEAKLRAAFFAKHPDYKEPTRQLELFDDDFKKNSDMKNLNTYIRKPHMKMVRKFNDELEAFRKETEEDVATLYEDAFTSFTLSTLRIDNGCLLYDYDGQEERDEIVLYDESSNDFFERDMDGIADIVGFFRMCLRRARKYWNMGGDRLDAIQEGTVDDIDLED